MKCDPDRAVSLPRCVSRKLRGHGIGTNEWWNDVRLDGQVPDALIVDLIDHAYDEVRKKFAEKNRSITFPTCPKAGRIRICPRWTPR